MPEGTIAGQDFRPGKSITGKLSQSRDRAAVHAWERVRS